MNIHNFYINFLESLEKHNVDYMLIGGHAVNYYGFSRATADMDLWVDTKDSNLKNLSNALINLDYDEKSVSDAICHLKEDHMIKIPKNSALIDILDSFMVKDDFEKCFNYHKTTLIDGVHIKIIALDDLLECKTKSNRMKDLLDVKTLKDLRKLRSIDNAIVDKVLNSKTKKINVKNKKKGFSI